MTTPVYNQNGFRFFDDDGSFTALQTENNDYTVDGTQNIILSIEVEVTNSKALNNAAFTLYASKNGGSYAQVTQSSTEGVQFSLSSNFVDGDSEATQRLSTSTLTFVAGVQHEDSAIGGTQPDDGAYTGMDYSGTDYWEVHLCLAVDSANASSSDYWDFEVRESDGTQLDGYDRRPRLTYTPAATDPEVSTADAVTLAENVTLDPLTLPGVDVSDAVTLAENVTLDPLTLPGVDVSDAVTLAENVTVNIAGVVQDLDISTSDAISVIEAPTIELSGNVFINTPDILDWEEGDLTDADSTTTGGTGSITASTTQEYEGSYSARTVTTDGSSEDDSHFAKEIVNDGKRYIRWFMYLSSAGMGTNDVNRSLVICKYSSTADTMSPASSLFVVFLNPVTARITASVADSTGADNDTGMAEIITEDAWHEIEVLLDETGTDVYWEMWIDGQSVEQHTGTGKASGFTSEYVLLGVREANNNAGDYGDIYYDYIEARSTRIGSSEPQISVDDSVTLGESVTLAALVLPGVSVDDSVTLAENVTVEVSAAAADLDISVSDAVTLGESVTLAAITLPGIDVSDAVTLGESVTIAVVDVSDLAISVSDGATVNESVDIDPLQLPGIQVSDAVTVNESVNVLRQVEGQLYISVSDGIVLGESVDIDSGDLRVTVSDAVTFVDAIVVSLDLAILVSSAITLGESVNLIELLPGIQVSDAVTLAENVTVTPYTPPTQLTIDVSDSIQLSEDLGLAVTVYQGPTRAPRTLMRYDRLNRDDSAARRYNKRRGRRR